MAEVPALPDAFLDFLRRNDLNPAIYAAAQSLPRYIRYALPNCSRMCSFMLLGCEEHAWFSLFFRIRSIGSPVDCNFRLVFGSSAYLQIVWSLAVLKP